MVQLEAGKVAPASGTAALGHTGSAAYTITGSAVASDMTQYIFGLKNTTVENLKQGEIRWLKGLIAQEDKELSKTTGPEEKKRLENNLSRNKQWLQKAEKTSAEKLQRWQKEVEKAKKRAAALDAYAKFSGTLSSGGKAMTVTKFPCLDTAALTITSMTVTVTKSSFILRQQVPRCRIFSKPTDIKAAGIFIRLHFEFPLRI